MKKRKTKKRNKIKGGSHKQERKNTSYIDGGLLGSILGMITGNYN